MSKEIKFPMPDGFAAPEDAQPGKPFEVMATVMMSEDGMLALSAIDGAPVASASDDDDEEEMDDMEETPAPEGDAFLSAIEKGMKS